MNQGEPAGEYEHVLSLTKCVYFLRAISNAEEFNLLPNTSSMTGGPVIHLIPYRDGEKEAQRVTEGFQRLLIVFIQCCF